MSRHGGTHAGRVTADALTAEQEASQRLGQWRTAAAACRRCPRMSGDAVLGAAFRPVRREILFVAEAPGRRGAVRTGEPLTGDASGRVFGALLATAGWSRADVAVTNAVLCWPQGERGQNTTPIMSELRNCSQHLAGIIDAVDPRVVVALGRTAFVAMGLLAPLPAANLCCIVGRAWPWRGRYAVALYHPSPRVLNISRSLQAQHADFARLRRTLWLVRRRERQQAASESRRPAGLSGANTCASVTTPSRTQPASSGGSALGPSG